MGPFTRAGALTSVSALALCMAPVLSAKPAQAQSFTVPNGQTVFGTQVMTGAGDAGHVEHGGTLATAGVSAVKMQADGQSLLNDGTLATTGVLAYGVDSDGANAAITNSGTISTTGVISSGIDSSGDNAVVANSGTIATQADLASGIGSSGLNAVIGNTGTVSTTGESAYGIFATGGNAAITNSGTIATTGTTAAGVRANGDDAVIGNSGTISTTGLSAYGIGSHGDDAVIDNTGTISTAGQDGRGIHSENADAKIENSGSITTSGDSAVAITSYGKDATITNSGKISTLGVASEGIHSWGENTVITNSGEISTVGDYAYGIMSYGINTAITNGGTISTAGADTYGIISRGLNAVIGNSGTISTTGPGSYGIFALELGATIRNSGVISTAGQSGHGIVSDNADATIENSGTVSTAGDNAYGVLSSFVNTTITNSGTISTTGEAAYGIFSQAIGVIVSNRGTISTTGVNSFGILASHADAVITNSGTVTSENSYSIVMEQSNATLNLLRGSVLRGNLQFGTPGSATLHIGPGLSTALQLDGVPATITASGMPFAVTGNAVYTADVTAIGREGEALADLTGGIFSAIDGRRSGDGAAAPLSYAADKAPQTKVFRTDDVPVREAWLKGFGGVRGEDGENGFPGYDQALAGFVSGMDVFASASGVAGVFLGGSWGQTDVELSQEIDALSGYGGVYGTFGLGTATLDVALAAGFSSYESERRVNNSLVGIETAEAEYDGWFVSPHLALTQPFVIGGQIVEAKVSVHYAGLFLDGYEETGSVANLSVGERDVHVFVGRAGLSVPVAFAHAGGGVTIVTPSFGVEGRAQFGDSTAAGSFMGTDIVLALDDGETLGGYAGLKIENETASGLTFFAAAEGLIEDDGATRVFAKSGVKARF